MINEKSLVITPEMVNLIAEIDEFKGAWRALGKLTPERLYALKHVATIESIGSSTRIEGAKLSNSEVEALITNVDHKSFRSRDEQEVAGYRKVMEEVFTNWNSAPFSENFVKQFHHMLLSYSNKDGRHRGEYKKLSNNVEAFDSHGKSLGVVFETASPFETPIMMQELFLWAQESLENKTLHPLIVIAIFVVVFLAIHPFQDGNGRLSRVLTTFLLFKTGYSYVQYSSLESVIEENKEKYYLSLHRTQSTLRNEKPNWEPWVIFFLRTLKKQKSRLEEKVKKEELMVASLPELSYTVLELAKDHGRITISEIINITNANRNTLKLRLRELVKKGFLQKNGKGKATWYTLS